MQQAALLATVALLLLVASATFAVLTTIDFSQQVRFDLVDHNGEAASEADFAGSYALVYFGFTNCPRICPTQMARMTAIIGALGGRLGGKPAVPVFISVDPGRDTVQKVRDYVRRFHPSFVGLTGSRVALSRAALSFQTSLPRAPKDVSTDYDVAHGAVIYLLGPDGRLLTHISYDAGTTQSISRLRETVL